MSSEPDGKKSTPPSPPPKSSTAQAYPEHDKLGPLPTSGARAHSLTPDSDLRVVVVTAYRDAIEKARTAAERASSDLDDSVHEYRKALRRARAVLALLRGSLPEDHATQVTDALRNARRAVSATRDLAVAPAAIARLELDDTTRIAAETLVAAARLTAPDRDEVIAHLRDGAARVAPTVEEVEAALPAQLDWSDISDGIGDTYRAARRALGRAKRSRRALHAWRRRTKELSYQLELVASGAGERTREISDAVSSLSDELGDVVDLIMLDSFVTTHAPDINADALEALTKTADASLRERGRDARRRGKDIFDRGGRRFARRLTKAVRRDLAPAPPADPDSGSDGESASEPERPEATPGRNGVTAQHGPS
jgi:CHAD domain-containing protein